MADKAGYDSAQLVSELRAIHTDGEIILIVMLYIIVTFHHG